MINFKGTSNYPNKTSILEQAIKENIKEINNENPKNDRKISEVYDLNYPIFKDNKRYTQFNKPFDPTHFRNPRKPEFNYQIPHVDHINHKAIKGLIVCLEKFPCGFDPQSINLLHPIHSELDAFCRDFLNLQYWSPLNKRIEKCETAIAQVISSTTTNVQTAELLEISLRTHFFQEMLKQEQLQRNYQVIENYTNTYETKSKNLLNFLTNNNTYKIPTEISLITIKSFKNHKNKEEFIKFTEKYEHEFYPPFKQNNQNKKEINELFPKHNPSYYPTQPTALPNDFFDVDLMNLDIDPIVTLESPSSNDNIIPFNPLNYIIPFNPLNYIIPFNPLNCIPSAPTLEESPIKVYQLDEILYSENTQEEPLIIPPLSSNHEIKVVKVVEEKVEEKDPVIPLFSYIDFLFGETIKNKTDKEIWNSLPTPIRRDALLHYNAFRNGSQGKVEAVALRLFGDSIINNRKNGEFSFHRERENLEHSFKNRISKDPFLVEGEEVLNFYYSNGTKGLSEKFGNWVKKLNNNPTLKGLFFQSIYEMAKSFGIKKADKDPRFAENNWYTENTLSIQALERVLHASHFITLHYPESTKDTTLFIRGNGPGMSWEKGIPLESLGNGYFVYKTEATTAPFEFKVVDKENRWSQGENLKFEEKALKTQISF